MYLPIYLFQLNPLFVKKVNKRQTFRRASIDRLTTLPSNDVMETVNNKDQWIFTNKDQTRPKGQSYKQVERIRTPLWLNAMTGASGPRGLSRWDHARGREVLKGFPLPPKIFLRGFPLWVSSLLVSFLYLLQWRNNKK